MAKFNEKRQNLDSVSKNGKQTYKQGEKTSETTSRKLRKNISSHVKISPLLWLHNQSRLSHQKTIKVKWFGSSLVFI